MAAELVGGAFLSASLQVLFDRLASREVVNFIRGKKLNDGVLKKLKIKLLSVNAVINDAEEKQFRDPLVKEWLHELKDAVHDAEDLLDEIATKALVRKLKAESRSLVRNFFSTSLNLFDREMVPKVEKILDRLEYIAKQKDELGLKEGIIGGKLSKRIPTTSLVDESDVYGRDDNREAIIQLLLSDDVSGSNICVIPIVGMGGIGKTTLAQLVYNDERVKEHFDLKAWVCVSEEFDVLRVTNTVLKAVTSPSQKDINDLNLLQVELKKKLREKKFLLVLDDVWNEDDSNWEALRIPFTSGKQGSKIIVTTRNESVASVMRTIPTYNLSLLKDDDCWLLFTTHAFQNGNSAAHSRLEEIGRDIVKKCKGLPLALKALGSLLRGKLDVKEWNEILNSEIWEIKNDKILPALGLSYCYLPLHLKPCFVYCSVFPKDWEMENEKLIQLWMAEGFLDSSNKNKRMEEVGDEYFNELVSRSFFQQSSDVESNFVMHDLVHDLAKFISGELHFSVEHDNSYQISEKTRHLSYVTYSVSLKLETIHNAKCLRTFLPLDCYDDDMVSLEQLLKLRCLRVLCLNDSYELSELPDLFGILRHLRYLDLSATSITRLPKSVTTLYNLQTLKLSWCQRLKKLPKDMHKLINLRNLDVYGCDVLKDMPAQMSKLKSLQRLSTYIVGKENGVKIAELGPLLNLQGTLHIKKLNNVVNVKDASEAKLKDKRYLEGLELDYDSDANTKDSLRERDVLEKLVPHTNLKGLSIRCYGGTRFPDWLGDHSFRNMVSLSLESCTNCCILPPLGQLPFLVDLGIRGFDGVQTVGPEFYGSDSSVTKPFPSLEILSFYDMNVWQEWYSFGVADEGRAFPCLRELHIHGCPILTGSLPQNLPSLTKHEPSFFDCLPIPLKKLKIENCEKFKFPVQQYHTSLAQLDIRNSCDALESFPLDIFPSLNVLYFYKCKNLESLSVSEAERPHRDLTSLTSLRIFHCPNFVSFPKGGLDASNSTSFSVEGCDNLKSLPERMHICLSNLSRLTIDRCDKLISRRMDWDLQSFPSLTSFSIYDGNLESFPEEGLLPSTLLHLSIEISCLKTLDNRGLQHLTSLETLTINNCPNLQSLPEEGLQHLTSLKTLEIYDCPNLQSLPEEGLPTSLTNFLIYRCPLLEKRCVRDTGEDWPKIAHIPSIYL